MKKAKSRSSKSKKQKLSFSQISSRLSTRTSLALLALSVAFMAGAGIAYATIPDGNGIIHGCYNASGLLRVIDGTKDKCSKGETEISWSQQGPAGPQGQSAADSILSKRQFAAYGSVGQEVVALPGFGNVTMNCAAAPNGQKLVFTNTSGQNVSVDNVAVANGSSFTLRDYTSPYASFESDRYLLSLADDSHVLSLDYGMIKNLPTGCTGVVQAVTD